MRSEQVLVHRSMAGISTGTYIGIGTDIGIGISIGIGKWHRHRHGISIAAALHGIGIAAALRWQKYKDQSHRRGSNSQTCGGDGDCDGAAASVATSAKAARMHGCGRLARRR